MYGGTSGGGSGSGGGKDMMEVRHSSFNLGIQLVEPLT